MRKYLIFIFWGLVTCLLVIASVTSESSSSILAEVEPKRYAVSFSKAVRIKEFFVVPGQQVKKGDPLIRVERPDLLLDKENKRKKIALLASNLDKKELQKENKLYLNKLEFQLQRRELENKIQRLKATINQQTKLSEGLSNLDFQFSSSTDSLLREQLVLLEKEQSSLMQEHEIDKREIIALFEIEESGIQAEIEQLEKEEALLVQEEEELIQYARVDGAIGNVYVEIGELVPSYTNLVSVYENNPTVIRAFTNEHDLIDIKSGDKVVVESTNRQHTIEGTVIEIGSRIIEYPQRLRTFDKRPSWGRELFIKIPEESKFLNGEKVFVILQK